MSTFKFLPVLISLFSILSATACDDNSNGNSGPNGGNQTPAAGAWKVTYYFDKKDETGNYAAYTFEFGANGSMSATNGSQTWNGTWGTGFDDSANKFLIDFNGAVPSALSEIEEDWRIVQMTDTVMHFEHTSGGNGDTDVLKFARN